MSNNNVIINRHVLKKNNSSENIKLLHKQISIDTVYNDEEECQQCISPVFTKATECKLVNCSFSANRVRETNNIVLQD